MKNKELGQLYKLSDNIAKSVNDGELSIKRLNYDIFEKIILNEKLIKKYLNYSKKQKFKKGDLIKFNSKTLMVKLVYNSSGDGLPDENAKITGLSALEFGKQETTYIDENDLKFVKKIKV